MITFGRNSSSRLFHNPKDPFISMVSFWHCQPNIYRILTHIIYHLWRFWTMFGHFWLWSIFNRIKDGIEFAYLTKIQQFVLYWTICSVCLGQFSLNSSQWKWTSTLRLIQNGRSVDQSGRSNLSPVTQVYPRLSGILPWRKPLSVEKSISLCDIF